MLRREGPRTQNMAMRHRKIACAMRVQRIEATSASACTGRKAVAREGGA
jgi:hypothetical protein